MKTQLFGPDNIPISRIALGCMGLAGTWNPAEVGEENRKKAIAAFEAALESGITFFDHADIYGNTACESIFKDCLAAVPGSRERTFIATKGGIRFSPVGHYDHSPEHLRSALRGSLDRMGIDSVDLYQLHRPDPLADPVETAAVLDEFVEQGLIKYVGVSNYYPHQLATLQKYLKAPIVSNQIAISLLRLDPIYEGAAGGAGSVAPIGDGVLDHCMELGITPLAYSPLGGGWLSGKREVPADHKDHDRIVRTVTALREMGASYGGATPLQMALAWLLGHPSGIVPLVGSNNPEHIREASEASTLELSRTDWYRLWIAARGVPVP